eukprot:TRINITY_DN118_c0_g1_i11.p2 TRINITY_DN118_c0_g1~~TRINITY_DN118_c0_g1_i11.p2  ORF type:complete len:102 (-),score=20.36 TRINITY_DN118_c0_g1_i11:702-1007(-)
MERCVLRAKEFVLRAASLSPVTGSFGGNGKRRYSGMAVSALRKEGFEKAGNKEEDPKVRGSKGAKGSYSSSASPWMPHPVTGDFVPADHFSDIDELVSSSS